MTTLRELNIEEAAKAQLMDDQKEKIINRVKEYQLAIAKAKTAVTTLEKQLNELLDSDIEDLVVDPWRYPQVGYSNE